MKVLLAILLALPALTVAQECSVSGDAIGFSLDMQTLATEKDCLKHCQNNTNCQWYSFDPKLGTCNSLYNRQSIDSSCTTCLHGENDCQFPSECFIKGGCTGAYIGRNTTLGTAEACLQFCYREPNCKWFTFLNVTRVCNLYSACIINENEPNAISGEKDCYEESNPVPHTSKVFIQHSTSTGIFTLPYNSTGGNATTCTKPPSFSSTARGTAGNVVSGSITICGGTTGVSTCYRLNATTNTWQTFPSMLYSTMYAAQIMSPLGWWVTGGYVLGTYSPRTSYYNGTHWNNGTNLPSGRMDHCLAKIDETQVFMSGGVTQTSTLRDAYIYNFNTGDWIDLPDMNQTAQEHACVAYRNGSDTIILTAGGGTNNRAVNAFNLSTRTWRQLANLPTNTLAATFVSNALDGSDMFLLNTYYGNVMKFNPTTQTFSLVSGLTTPVIGDYSTVIQVEDEQLAGCQ